MIIISISSITIFINKVITGDLRSDGIAHTLRVSMLG